MGKAAKLWLALFKGFDLAELADLGTERREAQLQARIAFDDYMSRLWQHAKAHGDDPATDPRYSVVSALRVLADGLYMTAWEPQSQRQHPPRPA